MKNKNEAGITLVILIITLVVLTFITYTVVSMGISMSGDAKFQNIQTYMLLIQTKCEYITHELAIGDNPDVRKYGEEITSGNYAGWYKLTPDELEEIGVKKSSEKDANYENVYYINYETNDVAYVPGIEHDDTIFYKLSDILSYANSDDIQ